MRNSPTSVDPNSVQPSLPWHLQCMQLKVFANEEKFSDNQISNYLLPSEAMRRICIESKEFELHMLEEYFGHFVNDYSDDESLKLVNV